MKTIKVFPTPDMSQYVYDNFYEIVRDNFQECIYMEWIVGGFVQDGEGKEGYDQNDVARCKIVDAWLIENGANNQELVLIKS